MFKIMEAGMRFIITIKTLGFNAIFICSNLCVCYEIFFIANLQRRKRKIVINTEVKLIRFQNSKKISFSLPFICYYSDSSCFVAKYQVTNSLSMVCFLWEKKFIKLDTLHKHSLWHVEKLKSPMFSTWGTSFS